MSATVDLACDLISRQSVTPADAGCQAVMAERLAAIGFAVEALQFGEVDNFFARRGQQQPLLVFAGHTDVVPTGPLEQWQSDPFTPTIRAGYLYGRGAADMKGSLAAMVTACERFTANNPQHQGSIGLLITSDEEGPAVDGTVKVIEHLQSRNEAITACIVGEPSSNKQLGDVIKNGRRGSLNGTLAIVGVQGHVAYPHQVHNPIHALGSIISALSDEVWDHGNDFFPPTSFQISNITAGTGATNVVPGEAEMIFNLRFSTEVSATILRQRVENIVETCLANQALKANHVYTPRFTWSLSGQPFLTQPGPLVDAVKAAIKEKLALVTELSTAGGTSDGRFIAPTGAQVVELGPVNATIHKINECVLLADLDRLSDVYQAVLENYLG